LFFAYIMAEFVLLIFLSRRMIYGKTTLRNAFFFRILKSNKEVGCLNDHVIYEIKIAWAIWCSHIGFHEDSSLFKYDTASF